MKYIRYATIIFISFLLTFIDVSFLSFLGVYGATILSSFLFVIIFSMTDKTKKDYIIAALSVVLFFSIFSSLPLFPIIAGFFLIPATIGYLRQHSFPEPSVLVSVVYFVISTALFEGMILLYLRAWNDEGFLAFGWFIFLNSFFGFISYAFYLKMRKNFTAPEIKL